MAEGFHLDGTSGISDGAAESIKVIFIFFRDHIHFLLLLNKQHMQKSYNDEERLQNGKGWRWYQTILHSSEIEVSSIARDVVTSIKEVMGNKREKTNPCRFHN